MYLLDTNVVSELRRARPHGAVLAWLEAVDDSFLHLSAVTLAEIQVQSMDLESLKLFYLEKQIECYEYNYTDEQLLSEMKDCVGGEEFTQFVGDLGN